MIYRHLSVASILNRIQILGRGKHFYLSIIRSPLYFVSPSILFYCSVYFSSGNKHHFHHYLLPYNVIYIVAITTFIVIFVGVFYLYALFSCYRWCGKNVNYSEYN